ncbi:hypothetical protein MNV49_006310 [Pseudohyphozyma bogoriensis]|nr:hypothetical protein MNV49_006310 [Pseudohyphozyma bogoriensis]
MLGAAIVDGGINFAIAYAMYHGQDNVTMWDINHNTVAGDFGVTTFIQGILTMIIVSSMVHLDVRKGTLVKPLASPWPTWVDESAAEGEEVVKGSPTNDLLNFAATPSFGAFCQKLFWTVWKGAVISAIYFFPFWGITVAAVAPRWSSRNMAHTWTPMIIKLVYGFTLGLLMNPIIALLAMGSVERVREQRVKDERVEPVMQERERRRVEGIEGNTKAEKVVDARLDPIDCTTMSTLPIELVIPILCDQSLLGDHRTLGACCLASRAFNAIATPRLYAHLTVPVEAMVFAMSSPGTVDRDEVRETREYRLAKLLLDRPELAKQVRHLAISKAKVNGSGTIIYGSSTRKLCDFVAKLPGVDKISVVDLNIYDSENLAPVLSATAKDLLELHYQKGTTSSPPSLPSLKHLSFSQGGDRWLRGPAPSWQLESLTLLDRRLKASFVPFDFLTSSSHTSLTHLTFERWSPLPQVDFGVFTNLGFLEIRLGVGPENAHGVATFVDAGGLLHVLQSCQRIKELRLGLACRGSDVVENPVWGSVRAERVLDSVPNSVETLVFRTKYDPWKMRTRLEDRTWLPRLRRFAFDDTLSSRDEEGVRKKCEARGVELFLL